MIGVGQVIGRRPAWTGRGARRGPPRMAAASARSSSRDAVAADELHPAQRDPVAHPSPPHDPVGDTRTVFMIGSTSWTRTISAPAAIASATLAAVPSSRSSGGAPSEQLADDPLAARADQQRQPAERVLELGQPMQDLDRMGRRLAEADARVDDQALSGDARAAAASSIARRGARRRPRRRRRPGTRPAPCCASARGARRPSAAAATVLGVAAGPPTRR